MIFEFLSYLSTPTHHTNTISGNYIIDFKNELRMKIIFKLSVRNTRRTYSRFLPVEVTVWGASVTTVSPSSPNLEGVLILLSALFVKRLRSSVDSLLLPRNRFPRSIVTYCKFRTLLCDQLYKA